MQRSIVELVFPRPEAWVVHHALVALGDRGRSAERVETTDYAAFDRLPDTVASRRSDDPVTGARRGIETGRVRFTRREATAVRDALTAHLAGGPLRDQKPGSDALRRVRQGLQMSPTDRRPVQ